MGVSHRTHVAFLRLHFGIALWIVPIEGGAC